MSLKQAGVAAPEDTQVTAIPQEHLVIYTDGGSRPTNPGFGGWGVHGYIYVNESPKKGTGNAKWILTAKGYAEKTNTEKLEPVTPIKYVDGFSSYPHPTNNAIAELDATYQGLLFASQYPLASILVLSDAEYVIKNFNSRVEIWEKNNWTLSNGKPAANKEEWVRLLTLVRELRGRGVEVTLEWIRSHSGNQGNDLADLHATLGARHSAYSRNISDITTTDPDGYWKSDITRHPFLNQPYLIFNTEAGLHQSGTYYQVTTGKSMEYLGRKARDTCYAVVRLAESPSVIESMIGYSSELEEGNSGLMLLDLNTLHNAGVYPYVEQYGQCALLQPEPRISNLTTFGKEPVTTILNPALLAYRAVDRLVELESVLTEFQEMQAKPGIKTLRDYAITPLTDILYETKVKVSKKAETASMELKSIYKVGFTKLEIDDAAYVSFAKEAGTIPLTLLMGIDLPDRNTLKRLETTMPAVHLVTWMESEIVIRYATVIQAGEDWGIWAGPFTNQRITPTAVKVVA